MSHADSIAAVPDHYEVICSTSDVKLAGYQIQGETTYGIQFHLKYIIPQKDPCC